MRELYRPIPVTYFLPNNSATSPSCIMALGALSPLHGCSADKRVCIQMLCKMRTARFIASWEIQPAVSMICWCFARSSVSELIRIESKSIQGYGGGANTVGSVDLVYGSACEKSEVSGELRKEARCLFFSCLDIFAPAVGVTLQP